MSRSIAATTLLVNNGSNFVKAFKTFSLTVSDSTSTEVIQEDFYPAEDFTDEQEVTFEDVRDALTLDDMDDLTQVEYDLPAHERCATHTMNLVASFDITKSLSTSSLSKAVYRSAFFPNALPYGTKRVVPRWHQIILILATLKRKLMVPT